MFLWFWLDCVLLGCEANGCFLRQFVLCADFENDAGERLDAIWHLCIVPNFAGEDANRRR
jgi:hypothetical protein